LLGSEAEKGHEPQWPSPRGNAGVGRSPPLSKVSSWGGNRQSRTVLRRILNAVPDHPADNRFKSGPATTFTERLSLPPQSSVGTP
jgi:hypothetical protein